MSRPFFFGGPQPVQQSSPYLVSFKAGKLTKAANGNTVTPIKDKKGLVYLHQSSDDQLMHFCWKDRVSGQVEEDLIIFPEDAEFVRVPQCTTGRVFVLKFKTSPRRLFFWSQEPKDDKDEEYVNKINEYINNPPAARGGGGGGGILSPSDLSLNTEDELRNLFSNPEMSTQQLMSVLGNVRGLGGPAGLASLLSGVSPVGSRSSGGGGGGSSTTPAAPQTPSTTPAVTSSSSATTASESSTSTTGGSNSPATAPTGPGSIRLQDLQSIISGISASQQASGSGQAGAEEVSIDLSSSITMEVLRPLLTNDAFMERVREKLPPVTATPPTSTPQVAEQFVATVQSPQFRQALDAFSAAVQSGQLGPVIQQFGLPEECVAAANNGSLEGFCRALQKSKESKQPSEAAKKSSAPSTPKKDDKPDDDPMALD